METIEMREGNRFLTFHGSILPVATVVRCSTSSACSAARKPSTNSASGQFAVPLPPGSSWARVMSIPATSACSPCLGRISSYTTSPIGGRCVSRRNCVLARSGGRFRDYWLTECPHRGRVPLHATLVRCLWRQAPGRDSCIERVGYM